jgi:hypothetical protein
VEETAMLVFPCARDDAAVAGQDVHRDDGVVHDDLAAIDAQWQNGVHFVTYRTARMRDRHGRRRQ